ncbi:polysaccharide pyruvyl transferase family protein [Candidatus Aminicenantes bacterium AC-335-K20]|jgi:polysaccharide pyruvyl transferase CsaB|nr:polysaccharide pyruvyl transferase family protein [SCandidatus Aminicenantes bacterium Aminicenantia_JdfR_composite]MCP2596541.1 polysaccharide pyruvyl transferase family protein [Candidatus Aminicenantes bacterium AC-335-G13]MCP2605452.1 polysaccharide pyruvyl transferase family protein [Candidatus Aminicenantes bacterium AC-335-O07]MCP2618261.1 polysaccharide pyruvyl transferase family protein [Candidatus Aminicenantes bacterium AC-335-A11]MCP2619245.1 polysaccharide pyruvyl transferase fa
MIKRVLIFGYYGCKNTGDDAMIYGLLQGLHNLFPYAQFIVLTSRPIHVPSELKSSTKFVDLKVRRVLLETLRSQAIILGGGTHIQDYQGNIRYLKILTRMFAFFLGCKLLRKKVYLLSIGIGPISTSWGKFLAKLICKLVDYISVRERESYEVLKSLGLEHKTSLAFDLAALLQPQSNSNIAQTRDGRKNIIFGVSILPFFEIYCGNKKKDLLFIHEIAKELNKWLGENDKRIIRLFVFRGKSKEDDVTITKLLYKRLQPTARVELIPYNPNPIKMLSQVATCDAFIGMRFHSSLFAYLCDIPLLMIGYHPKCQALAQYIGLPAHAIISIEEILTGAFGKYLNNLSKDPNKFRANLSTSIARERAKDSFYGLYSLSNKRIELQS